METNHAIILSAYKGFNARNIDAVLALMHEDVDWPNGMEGGRVHGVEAVRAYWTRQWEMIDPHVEPLGFDLDDLGRVVVDVHQVVLDMSGTELSNQRIHHLYTIEDHLIRKMEIE